MVTMTKERAIQAAKRIAKKSNDDCFVVYEGGGFGYQAADYYELITFFAGEEPVCVVDPDGWVH